jgi:hypothetical protein
MMATPENDRGLQIAQFGTTVIARTLIAIGENLLLAKQGGDTVGQLDSPPAPGLTFSR